MVVCKLCWFYALSFWSTLSSHFGIGVNSVLCSGSLEHFEHVISHFSKKGILKVLLGQMIKSSVWGILWNLKKNTVQFSWTTLGLCHSLCTYCCILGHQNPFHMIRTALWNAWASPEAPPRGVWQTPFPCALRQKIPDSTREQPQLNHFISAVSWIDLGYANLTISFVFVYLQISLNQRCFAGRCSVDDKLFLFVLLK